MSELEVVVAIIIIVVVALALKRHIILRFFGWEIEIKWKKGIWMMKRKN